MSQDDVISPRPHSATKKLREADRTLIIGNRRRWNSEGRITSGLRGFAFLDFAELTKEALFQHQPDIILSPLVGDKFDVIEVATTLLELGYNGRYRAIAETVPDVAMIRQEVGVHAPKLDFDVLVMIDNPQEQALRSISDHDESAQHFPDSERRTA